MKNLNPQTSSSTGKVWFITGSSRGFGRFWATAALERGDTYKTTPTHRLMQKVNTFHIQQSLP